MIKITYMFSPYAMLLRKEQALHLSIHKIKLHAYVWLLSLKIASRVWGCAKKRKKQKMHTQRRYGTCLGMSKKTKRKDSPLSKKNEKERWCIQRSSYTIHQKYSHTCTSWSMFMTCFSFGSSFWLIKIWEAGMPSNPPNLQLHKNSH